MNNRFGVDVSYFSKELKRLEKSLQNRTRDELHRYLVSLAKIVEPPTIAQQPHGAANAEQICPHCKGSGKLPHAADVGGNK